MKIKKILEINNLKEKEKKHILLWFLVFFSMAFVLIIWFFNLNKSIDALKKSEINFTPSVDFSELSEKTSELNRILQESKEDDEKSGFMDENWIDLAKEKVVQEDFFENEEDFYDFIPYLLEEEDGAIKVGFNQYYKNILVEGGFVLVYFDSTNTNFLKFEDNLKKGIEIDVNPEVSAKNASEIVLEEVAEDYDFDQAILAVIKNGDDYSLVWKISFDDVLGKFFVDAKSGEMLLSEKVDR